MITQDKLKLLIKDDIIEYKNGESPINIFKFIKSKKVYTGTKKSEYYVKSIQVLVDGSIIWISITDKILEVLTVRRLEVEYIRNEKLKQLGICG